MRKGILVTCGFLCVGVLVFVCIQQHRTLEAMGKDLEKVDKSLARSMTRVGEIHKENNDLRSQLEQEVTTKEDLEINLVEVNEEIVVLQQKLVREDLVGWNVVEGELTAYSPYDNVSGIEHGGDASATSTGRKPGKHVFAVDPKKIPYNSEMILIHSGGKIETGVAGDTGGAMRRHKGYLVDIYKDTYKETVAFGRRPAVILWRSLN